jgi:hypothetical protein
MNKQALLPVLLLIIALSAATATAMPSISLGADITGIAEQKTTFSDTLNVLNNGEDNLSITITISDLKHTSTSDTISRTRVSITPASITNLEVGTSEDVEFNLIVPDNQRTGTYEATITVTFDNGTETDTKTATLTLDVTRGNHLVISRVRMSIDGERETLDDGDRHSENAKPRDDVELEIEVRNTFSDLEIEDIEIEVLADNDLDWDEEEFISDLRSGRRETITLIFSIPEARNIDDGTYDITIFAYGIDEEGKRHEDSITISLRIRKERYDLELYNVQLSPNYLDCGQTPTTRLSMNIENVGQRRVTDGTIVIKSQAMKEDLVIRDLRVDEDDYVTRSYTLPLRSDLQEGAYFIEIELYTSTSSNDLTSVESVALTVFGCGTQEPQQPEEEEEEEPKTEIEVIVPTPAVPSDNVVYKASGSPQRGLFDSGSNTYLILLIVIIVLLIILIGVAAVALTRK